MANTYVKLADTTLSTTASSITFNSLSQSYTDLVIRLSLKSNYTGGNEALAGLYLNSSSSNLSNLYLLVYASSSTNRGSDTNVNAGYASSSTSFTTDAYSNTHIYLSNYSSSTLNKNWFISNYAFRYDATCTRAIMANRWQNSAAVGSITINSNQGSFVSGSNVTIYGIKNS